ncbi:MAG: ATP-binding protein [Gammaproteobacteria bacterium]
MAQDINYFRQPKAAKRRLLMILILFFFGLSLPVYFLLDRVYSQLENEDYFRLNTQAKIVVEQIDDRLLTLIDQEQARPIAEYSFFNVLESSLLQSTGIKFSPLSSLPPRSNIPALTGYFQVDPNGAFHIPQLPTELNKQVALSVEELASRRALKQHLRKLLAVNQRQVDNNAEEVARQAVKNQRLALSKQKSAAKQGYRFDDVLSWSDADSIQQQAKQDELNVLKTAGKKTAILAGKSKAISEQLLGELNIDTERFKQNFAQNNQDASTSFSRQRKIKAESRFLSRKEVVKLPQQSSVDDYLARSQATTSVPYPAEQEAVSIIAAKVALENNEQAPAVEVKHLSDQKAVDKIFSFESEVGPLQLLMLDQSMCFFRRVWYLNSLYVQGFIVDRDEFFNAVLMPMVNSQQIFEFSSLLLVTEGVIISHIKTTDIDQENLIYRSALTSPFQQLEIIVNAGALTTGSETVVVNVLAGSLLLIGIIGLLIFYRLGAGQIDLAGRQRNFISAVNHELKTPLTSIRMYGEILRSDWVLNEDKKRSYYDFIFFESERLSRLINNVLQLARLENNREEVVCQTLALRLLFQRLKHQISLQIEPSGFQCLALPGTEDVQIQVDEDAMTQIMINLVDNAIKFASGAEKKVIEIGYRYRRGNKMVLFFVRDYGPGIEKKQMKKIFQLFYRSGDELTRTQPGTGIGLALVVQLAESMNAQVDLVNRDPGAEFQVKFKLGKT